MTNIIKTNFRWCRFTWPFPVAASHVVAFYLL